MLLARSVGLAMPAVLQNLSPAERVAFVLHDMFDLSFDGIPPIVGRSSTAARQLASRARGRVQSQPVTGDATQRTERRVVDAFLAAARDCDFEAPPAVLDPDVVLRSDAAAIPGGAGLRYVALRSWR